MADLTCKKPKLCEPKTTPAPEPCSPAFDLCVGDRVLKWDGFCPTVERTRRTPDGTYTSVTVVDGCIVSYGYADEPTYTPPYCSPNPINCQETPSGSGTTAVSTHRDNILVQASGGLFARAYVQADAPLSVTGTGTQTNPYTITFNGTTGDTTIVGEAGISQRESNGVTYIGLTPTGVRSGMYNGFSINEYGQIIGFSDSVARDGSPVRAGAGLTATDDGSVVTIAHEEHDLPTATVFGGFAVALNKSGHITDIERLATVSAGTYAIGAYKISITEFGGITHIVQDEAVPEAAGSFTTSDNKVVSYDITGRITDVDELGSTPNAVAPRPIRDMYKFTATGAEVKKEVYGTDIAILHRQDRSFTVQLPSYVVSPTQISVHGAVNHATADGQLTITHTPFANTPEETTITLTLRA